MSTNSFRIHKWMLVLAGLLVIGVAGVKWKAWWPAAQSWVRKSASGQGAEQASNEHDHAAGSSHEEEGHDHGGHEHGHSAENSLELSPQAMANLGLASEMLQPIALETFQRTIAVPGIVVERPGRTRIEVSTPMSGVITNVLAVEGEAVLPGTPLFDLRITAEELVTSQTELLKTIGDLDVEEREITRLTKVTESGAVSQKTLLDRQYARDKLKNLMVAQREALRLHGLSETQVDEIISQRKLFRELRIVAPMPGNKVGDIQLTSSEIVQTNHSTSASFVADVNSRPLVITTLGVHVGQTIQAGTTLAELVDYSELSIEGRAFEKDADLLSVIAKNNWKLSAVFEGANQRETVTGLDLIYAANAIQAESRTLPFYVRLPNEIVRTGPSPNGHEFVEWRHRPGRRVQLLLPVEELKDQIVIPVSGIVREGAESYVFQQNGKHFDRVTVHVKYRDSRVAVIANDGTVFPGDVVARTGAHQMQMALKNKSGGGVDPHAGHNH